MKIKFTKMQGAGNDYIYVDCTDGTKIKNIPELKNLKSFLLKAYTTSL